ncbi:HPr family phosphocarrier protein [Parablautia intestinalis]|uniref:HPr family phosphocarrier protein n=1 Tax=Parablautia intestinalis TaxID=2320100 RepID=A0A3A9APQ8_9FIRM|nr:HPr family phosphocarrier protein [Parablautia intestinalis]MCI8614220.1 HPr family phosphocarrier protein [Lachnospiraceae bacterium]MDE7046397.1 HPr family phosphocarrier protein [Lachnospiraceae bacterium]RKI89521.1 HPr family phosphocarrier protein [Parablautia intestinalis]
MKEFQFTINDPVGIHARPAGLLVKKAAEFQSNITINGNGKSADAKKLIKLMSLGIKQGMEITCQIEGEDEDIACEAMINFFKDNL